MNNFTYPTELVDKAKFEIETFDCVGSDTGAELLAEVVAWRTRFPELVGAVVECKYGCHCELMPGQIPDSCVLGTDKEDDCVHAIFLARGNKDTAACAHWKKIL